MAVAMTLLVAGCSNSPAATSEPLSITVAQAPRDIPAYDRDEWGSWTDEDSDCQDTRQEVLVEESATTVTFTDTSQCRVASGEWTDPYTDNQFTVPGALEIDHMAPLANAHRSGGWMWSDAKKRQYTNDLSYEGHLIAVLASENRSKGSSGPADWKPPERDYWCQYAIDWITIKNTWQLTASEMEAVSLTEMLNTCTPSISLTVEAGRSQPTTMPSATPTQAQQPDPTPSATPTLTQQPDPTPSATPTDEEVYGSCEESEAAGETRVLGSEGGGHGFPKAKIPSARDGDGDGIVCEKSSPLASTPSATPTPPQQPDPTPEATPTDGEVYGSCDEAEAAGEQRVRGSSGDGRGFPQSRVPSARDGDGDGVVCEK